MLLNITTTQWWEGGLGLAILTALTWLFKQVLIPAWKAKQKHNNDIDKLKLKNSAGNNSDMVEFYKADAAKYEEKYDMAAREITVLRAENARLCERVKQYAKKKVLHTRGKGENPES